MGLLKLLAQARVLTFKPGNLGTFRLGLWTALARCQRLQLAFIAFTPPARDVLLIQALPAQNCATFSWCRSCIMFTQYPPDLFPAEAAALHLGFDLDALGAYFDCCHLFGWS